MIKRIYIYLYLIRGFEQKTEYKVLYRYKDVAKKFVIKTNVVANFYDAAEILDIIYKEIKYDCDIVFLTNDFFIENYVKKKIGEEKKENFFRNIIEIKSFIEEKKIFEALRKELS